MKTFRRFRPLLVFFVMALTFASYQNCGEVFSKQDSLGKSILPPGASGTGPLPRQTASNSSSSTGGLASGDGTTQLPTTGTGTGATPVPTAVPTAAPTAAPTATPVPTPPPTPVPSSKASTTIPTNNMALPRNCGLDSVGFLTGSLGGDVANGINYQFCMVLGRFSNNQEGTAWYHGIKDGDVDPESLAPALFGSTEFAQRYGTPLMTPEQFGVFLYRLLCYREPTLAEMQQLATYVGTQTGQQAAQTAINVVMASPGFAQANPFLIQLRAEYQ